MRVSLVLEPSQGLSITGESSSLLEKLSQAQTYILRTIREGCVLPPLLLDITAMHTLRQLRAQRLPLPLPCAAELSQTRRTNHDFGKPVRAPVGGCRICLMLSLHQPLNHVP